LAYIYKLKDRGNYVIKVSIQGKQYCRSLKTGDLRTAQSRAKKYESQIIFEHFNGIRQKRQPTQFNEIARQFLNAKKDVSPATLETYRRVINAYQSNKLIGGNQTQRLYNRHLSSIYNWAIKHNLTNENPFKHTAKSPIPKIDYYSDIEVKEILSDLPDNKVGDIIQFAFLTGARLGELANLSPEDILPDKIILRGKSGIRTIPTTPRINSLINPRIFNFNTNSLRLALSRNKLSATKIRHTFATVLVKKGVSIYIVAKLLEHKSVKTTETYYAHLAPEEIKNHTDWLGW